MSAKILITGGTGLVGTRLTEHFLKEGYEVFHLSRSEGGSGVVKTYQWDIHNNYIDEEALKVDYIIHLAGAGVADSRWTSKRKQIIYNSRIDSTNLLFQKVKENGIKLKGLISASAIGYYGLDTGDSICMETDNPGKDFLADVVVDWEKAADQFENELNIPTAKIRIGVVLSNEGGALPKLVQPIKFGVGAPIGSGQQYMSWIHLDDLVGIFAFAIEKNLRGTYNAVAPNPETNKSLSKQAAKALNKPFFFPNVPGFVLKLIFGEMAGILLGGNRVSSKKIEENGFIFKFPTASKALANLLK
jgi:hypothetical protein